MLPEGVYKATAEGAQARSCEIFSMQHCLNQQALKRQSRLVGLPKAVQPQHELHHALPAHWPRQ